MTTDQVFVARNESELQRLRALCARMEADDFERVTATGWTVATTLAHLAFWDREAITCLANWQKLPPDELPSRIAERSGWIDGETAAPWAHVGIAAAEIPMMSIDALNAALVPEWSAMPPVEAAQAAVADAEALDAALASLDPTMVELMRRGDKGWMLDAWEHRKEHIDAIEAALTGANNSLTPGGRGLG